MKKRIVFLVVTIVLTLLTPLVAANFVDDIRALFSPEYSPFNASLTIDLDFAPSIEDLNFQYYICERNQSSIWFNVTDLDGDDLLVDINPKNPFFVQPTFIDGPEDDNPNSVDAEIYSGILTKLHINPNLGYRDYSEQVSVTQVNDALRVDTQDIVITVIEINNPPNISNELGTETIWTIGDDSNFYHAYSVFDIEDNPLGSTPESLNYRLNFLNSQELFLIDSSGTINYTTNVTDLSNKGISSFPFVVNLEMCVNDTAISPTHSEIVNECGHDGSERENCDNFFLVITNLNRAPLIVDYWPINLSFNASGNEDLYFNVSVRDPDANITDISWYIDGELIEEDLSVSFSEFNYAFGCGVSGQRSVSVNVTDGLLTDSIEWSIDVSLVSCGSSGGGGGGGGSSNRKVCEEKWGCEDWNICQNAKASFDIGVLSLEDYAPINELCIEGDIPENCGYHIRNCFDVNECGGEFLKPDLIGQCYFTNDPSCEDGLKNCHAGECELFADCGGPCEPCPTCSDGKQNQGEKGVDCEGPCPARCELEQALYKTNTFRWILIIIVLFVFMIVVLKLVSVVRARRRISIEVIKERENGLV